MKIGILVLSIGAFGKRGYYNLQEIGLGKALGKVCEEVYIYKLVPQDCKETSELVADTDNTYFHCIPSSALGTNGIPDFSKITNDIDALICFSDTQLFFHRAWKWAKKNSVPVFPYIGVIESHSSNKIISLLSKITFSRNKKIYRQCICFSKTAFVQMKLADISVNSIVAPVGLDISLLNGHTDADIVSLREEFSVPGEDKILLFIGRMNPEKQPLKMIELFKKLIDQDEHYQLIMVGTGELLPEILKEVNERSVHDRIHIIEKIPNDQIWKLYKIAHVFINLNQQEIFGMAILEAMFFRCRVIAWNAPGPNLIIEDKKSGRLVNSNESVISAIIEDEDYRENARVRVLSEFTWDSSAKKILQIIEG